MPSMQKTLLGASQKEGIYWLRQVFSISKAATESELGPLSSSFEIHSTAQTSQSA